MLSADGKRLKDWKVRERRLVEEMTPDTLRQVLADAVAQPDIQVCGCCCDAGPFCTVSPW